VSISGKTSISGSLIVSSSNLILSGTLDQQIGDVYLKGLNNQTSPQSHIVTYNNTTGQLFITASNALGGGGGGSGSSLPGGINGAIQYNDAGVLNGSSRFTLIDDGNNANLNLTGSITLTGNITGSKNLTVESIDLLGVGATTFTSDTNLNLSASNAVVVKSPIFRLTPTTTSSVEGTTQNGDIIYDSNQNKFFGRANGVWVAFH
jgi:hypothetical protein